MVTTAVRGARSAATVSALVVSIAVGSAFGCGHNMTSDMSDVADAGSIEGATITITTYRDALPQNTTLVAFRDGDGGWQVLTGHDGVYVAQALAEQYSVVTACAQTTNGQEVSQIGVYYQGANDPTEIHAPGCSAFLGPSVHVLVDLQGITSPGQYINVVAGNQQTVVVADFAEFTIPRGLRADVLAELGTTNVVRFPTLSGLHDESLTGDLAAGGSQTERHGVTVVGSPTDPPPPYVLEWEGIDSFYWTPNLQMEWDMGSVASLQYITLPVAMRQPQDVADIRATVTENRGGIEYAERSVQLAIQPGAEPVLTLPDPMELGAAGFDPATHRLSASLHITPPTLRTADYTVDGMSNTDAAGVLQRWTLHLGGGWIAKQPYSVITNEKYLTVLAPDLTDIPGWNDLKFPTSTGALLIPRIERVEHDDPMDAAPIVGRRVLRNAEWWN